MNRGGDPPKLYIAHLGSVYVIVNNRLSVNCTLSWRYQLEEQSQQKTIGANTLNEPILVRTNRGQISFAAKSQQRALAVNDQEKFILKPLTSQDDEVPVYNLEITGLQYYYNINVKNLEFYQSRLSWDLHGKRYSDMIEGRQTKPIVITDNKASRPMQPVYFSAYRFYRNKPMFMNNNRTFMMWPTTDQNKNTTIYISGRPTVQGFVYINLAIFNNVGENVLLKWSTGNSKFVPRGVKNYILRLPFPEDQIMSMFQFTSYTVESNERLSMNQKESLYLQPWEDNALYNVEINRIG